MIGCNKEHDMENLPTMQFSRNAVAKQSEKGLKVRIEDLRLNYQPDL